MKISIIDVNELSDGSVVVNAHIDEDAFMLLAEIGFNKLLTDAAEKALEDAEDGHSNTEGATDEDSGAGGDQPI